LLPVVVIKTTSSSRRAKFTGKAAGSARSVTTTRPMRL
jgi:hypothetical protein